ncbi:DUF3077 domain-containing protein [Pseudomonas sp. SBB6]|uniref:DUF3077 domain-containing protein n=1 Tax=Pseudomonas sp. SBB6 TaxID=2962032 RepID=UPI0020B7C092|nr:DUF3077 domain-containing protein [Pseudomonas sp. SBB6]MCP3752770.1 DUF3077 domain-containing protein [Pseudomonas sp. SBB6]
MGGAADPGIPSEQALEHASLGASEEDPTLAWAAHLLGEMAKAIVDDVGLGLQQAEHATGKTQ